MTAVATFYRFVKIDDGDRLAAQVLDICKRRNIVGTVLIAAEGINGTIAHPNQQCLTEVIDYLRADSRFGDMCPKWSTANTDNPVFYRLKVRVSREIVSFGRPYRFDAVDVPHVSPTEWNDLIDDPDVLVVDVRNTYESDIGMFENAIRSETTSFREFPQFVERNINRENVSKVAMYCTGGIRCEKAAQLMQDSGFPSIVQLDGGILRYLSTVSDRQSLWNGECFVFDQRVSLTSRLDEGSYQQCFACRHPVSSDDRQSPHYRYGVSCPHCYQRTTSDQRTRYEERVRQQSLAVTRGEGHLGSPQDSLGALRGRS